MEVRSTNIYDQDNIDFKNWVAALLWHQIVYHKNEFSGYELIINPAEYVSNYKKGDIISDTRFLSYYIGETRKLSWKELALVMGFWKDHMLPDHHVCGECPLENKCYAYFKYDDDQERCNGWMESFPDKIQTIDEEYEKFIRSMMIPSKPTIELTPEQMEELEKTLKENGYEKIW